VKINIEFDMTPEEFRRAMGLPDVQEFQKELMNKMMDKMMSGEDGYDALSLFQPMMKEGMSTMDQMQKTMMNMMSGYMGGDKENNNE
jgi:acyl-homoserine lactone acylase PvdQ